MRKEVCDQKKRIEENTYFYPTLKLYNNYFHKLSAKLGSDKEAAVKILDFLELIMRKSQPDVEQIIQERKQKGEISNPDQTRKSVAGNNFQFLVVYSLIKNIELQNLPENLIILKTKNHKIVNEHATIKVGKEIQKPDMDIIVFTEEKSDPIAIYSCKTSLRERAGQTYKWKLLIDVVKHCPTLKEKYELDYKSSRDIKVGLITPNFYNEITNPQQRGMFKFFDYVYIAKNLKETTTYVKRLSLIIEDLKNLFR